MRRHLVVSIVSFALFVAAPAADARADVRQDTPPAASVSDRLVRARTAVLTGSAPLEETIDEIKRLLALDPTLAEAHLLLGLAYRSEGSSPLLPEAIAEFRQALALDPALVAGRYYLANSYLDLNRPGRAREELEAGLERLPDQPQFLTLLSEAERRLGNAARAVELAQRVLASTPNDALARYYGGLALLDMGRRDDGVAYLEAVANAGVPNIEAFLRLGTLYLEDNRIDDATGMLVKAAIMAPTRPDIRIALGRAYRLAGLLSDAEQQLALALPPGSAIEASAFYEELQGNLYLESGLLRMQQARLDEAVAALRRALDFRPAHGPTLQALAEALARQGNYELAAEHAARAEAAGAPVSDAVRARIESRGRDATR